VFTKDFSSLEEDVKIDQFVDSLVKQWGSEETVLRASIFIQFIA